MTFAIYPLEKTATIFVCLAGEGALRQHFFRHGPYPQRRGDHGEICPYGRPYGAAHPQL